MSEQVSDSTPLTTTDDERRRILNRLRRLEGQIRGLQAMVEAGQDCEPVLNQVMAARSALNQIGLLIIRHSMKTCLLDGEPRTKDELVDEALTVLLRYVNLPETWSAPLAD
jgi:DNA-binding FrmR family transcriptional regulator